MLEIVQGQSQSQSQGQSEGPLQKPYQKIFVVGCPRSGTSWTSEMIAQHPDIVRLYGESHLYKLFYDPFTYLKRLKWRQRLELKAWIFKQFGPLPIFTGFNSDQIWAGFPRIYRLYEKSDPYSGPHTCVDRKEFATLIKAARAGEGDDLTKVKRLIEAVLETAFYAQGGDRHKTMLEKTPMHLKYIDVILESFPEAKVIEIVRDVRGVCASWQARAKTQRWARKPVSDLVNQWVEGVELGEKHRHDSALGDRILQVRYEDLRQDTATHLHRIFTFIGLPLTDSEISGIAAALDIKQVKQKGEGQHVRKGIVDAWKNELSQDDIELCNQMAAPQLEKLGYLS
ncbi:MAG: sulfotransferase [Phormidesmis sp.]